MGRRRSRSRTVLAGTVLALLAGQPAWAAGSDDVPVYAPAADALSIEGAPNTAEAEEIEPGHIYSDTIGPDEKIYYRVRLDAARTSAYISAVARPEPDAEVAYNDGITTTLITTGGDTCSPGSGNTFGTEQARPLGDSASRKISEDGYCQEAGTYYVQVERATEAGSDRSDWPLEISFMREPGLKGGPAATKAPTGWSSQSPTPATGDPVERKGGTGFNDARALKEGVWKDRLLPGQTVYYRVPLRWGQQLTANAELAQAELEDPDGTAYVPNGLTMEILNTGRWSVMDSTKSYDGTQAALGLGPTAPAAYNNRYESTDAVSAMRFSGWYYVAVTLDKEVGGFTKGKVPLVLRLNIDGAAGEGPGYDGNALAAGFGVGDDDQAAADSGATPAEATRNDTMRVLGMTGIGTGTVLVLGLGAWTLIARRRAASSGAPAGPVPQSPVPDQGYGPPPAW